MRIPHKRKHLPAVQPAVAVLLALLLAACAAGSTNPTPTGGALATSATAPGATTTGAPTTGAPITPTAPPSPAAGTKPTAPAAAAATATPTLAPGMFRNPVYDHDFPDPDVLKVGDLYYAYATNSGSINIQVLQSPDLVNWSIPPGSQHPGEALPKLPAWANPAFGNVWAPEVTTPASGQGYLMYFVARYKIGTAGGTQCIGVATAEHPEGPFTSTAEKPLICQVEEGGSIDPSTFVDEDGQRYILWKNDGNSMGGQTWLYLQPVSDDGLSLTGELARLISADAYWEGILVEAPTLWKHNGKYYLFYSANAYNTPRYAAGVAMAEQIRGPYTKAPHALLKTDIRAGIVGPGGQDVVVGPQGDEWVLFHGWAGEAYRRLYLAPLTWEGGWPVVKINGREAMQAP